VKFIDLEQQYRLYKKEIDRRMAGVIERQAFIMGPEVEELERTLASWVGVRHGIGVASGTEALLVALMALGTRPGDEVVTTPFTFVATAEVISLLGARPVFADIDPVSYNLDPDAMEAALTAKTRAVIAVSLYGKCANFERINDIAKRRGIAVIEDAAQSFGATRFGKRSCALSTIGCTSFFPSKPLGCWGDGGMVFTDDDALAKPLREIRVHGQDRRYHHAVLGVNARLDTLQAAVLLGKWPHFEEEVRLRVAAAKAYTGRLAKIPGVRVPIWDERNTHVFGQYTIQVDDRDTLARDLAARDIPTAVHYPIPLHLQPAFAGLGYREGSFPVSEAAARRVISLPMHPFITGDEIDRVCDAIRESLGR
jgi:UDP-2-acetamido-2-deoxy-ribo-hexuluronate aminotransferase